MHQELSECCELELRLGFFLEGLGTEGKLHGFWLEYETDVEDKGYFSREYKQLRRKKDGCV